MDQRRSVIGFAAAILLALAAVRPGLGATPPAPWITEDIGTPSVPGSADVDANGVWTLTDSGVDIWYYNDGFHYAYQRLKGDGSITAQVLSYTGGNAGARKAGLMIRADNSDTSPNVLLAFAPSPWGLFAEWRLAEGDQAVYPNQVGNSTRLEPKQLLRLQRTGNDVAGFYSLDGQLWTQASFAPVTLPSLGADALFGLALTAALDGKTATAQFGQVAPLPGFVSVYGALASAADRSVRLQWRELPTATGYNVYRGPGDLSTGPLVKLNSGPVVGTTYTDSSDGLVVGTPVTYAIAPIFTAAGGTPAEGPKVDVSATPVAVPTGGWLGTSMNEAPKSGSVAIDPSTGEITLRGAGGDYFDGDDQGYFVNQLATGDVQVTVKALTKAGAAAGIMISESLDGSGRRGFLSMDPGVGLIFQVRTVRGGYARFKTPQTLNLSALKPPVTLRLIRTGNTIIPQYSTDDGKNFLPAAGPLTLDDLPPSLYVGIAAVGSNGHFTTSSSQVANLVKTP